jgi:hypothetical protein
VDTTPTEEHIGAFTLYRRENRDAKGPFYILSWACTWLPGTYETRDAALLAVGIVTGGESRFPLGDLARWCQYWNDATRHNGYITVEAIMAALGKATQEPGTIEVHQTPDRHTQ